MIENIALISGIVGIVFSSFTLISLFLLKKNILDILRKDALIFDQNFELKQKYVAESLNLVDEIYEKGRGLIGNANYIERAKKCYNELVCVLNDTKLADVFFDVTMNPNYEVNLEKVRIYKMLCRKDLGFKIANLEYNVDESQYVRTSSTSYSAPAQPVQRVQPIQHNPAPAERPQVASQPAQRVQPIQSNPSQAKPQVAPQPQSAQRIPSASMNPTQNMRPVQPIQKPADNQGSSDSTKK